MRAHMPEPHRPPLSIVMAGVSAPTTPHRIARRGHPDREWPQPAIPLRHRNRPTGQPTRTGALTADRRRRHAGAQAQPARARRRNDPHRPPMHEQIAVAPPRRAAVHDCGHAPVQWDEEQERTVGLLLLGKGAVLAYGFDRPLAVEMDEQEQSGLRCPDAWKGAVSPSLLLATN